jgi:hypothetical protein
MKPIWAILKETCQDVDCDGGSDVDDVVAL